MKRQRKTPDADQVMQGVIDLFEAQIAANNGQVDLVELKRCVARAIWRDAWSDDLLDQLPSRIAHCLDKVVNASLLQHGLDLMFDDIEAARD